MPRFLPQLRTQLLAASMLMALSQPAFSADYVMMKIGESEVTAGDVERQWSRLFPEGQAPALDAVQPEMRQNFLRGIMVEHVLYDEAKKAGLEEDLAVKAALEEARRTVLVRELLARKSGQAVSESAISSVEPLKKSTSVGSLRTGSASANIAQAQPMRICMPRKVTSQRGSSMMSSRSRLRLGETS